MTPSNAPIATHPHFPDCCPRCRGKTEVTHTKRFADRILRYRLCRHCDETTRTEERLSCNRYAKNITRAVRRLRQGKDHTMYELVEHRGLGHVRIVGIYGTLDDAITARAEQLEENFDDRRLVIWDAVEQHYVDPTAVECYR